VQCRDKERRIQEKRPWEMVLQVALRDGTVREEAREQWVEQKMTGKWTWCTLTT
jgi:hypothetical protein